MTDIEKVELLTANSALTTPFTDDEIQAFLDMCEGSVLLAAALICDQLAIKASATAQSFMLGDYSVTGGSNTVTAYQNQAKALRELEYNTPAFAVAEDNVSESNYRVIMKNYIMRTEA